MFINIVVCATNVDRDEPQGKERDGRHVQKSSKTMGKVAGKGEQGKG